MSSSEDEGNRRKKRPKPQPAGRAPSGRAYVEGAGLDPVAEQRKALQSKVDHALGEVGRRAQHVLDSGFQDHRVAVARRTHRDAVRALAAFNAAQTGLTEREIAQRGLDPSNATSYTDIRRLCLEVHATDPVEAFLAFVRRILAGSVLSAGDLRTSWKYTISHYHWSWKALSAHNVPDLEMLVQHFLSCERRGRYKASPPPMSFQAACERATSELLRSLLSNDGVSFQQAAARALANSHSVPIIDMEGRCAMDKDFFRWLTVSDIYQPNSKTHLTHIIIPDRNSASFWSGGRVYRIEGDSKPVKISATQFLQDIADCTTATELPLVHFSTNNIEPKRIDDLNVYANPVKRPSHSGQTGAPIMRYLQMSTQCGEIPLLNVDRLLMGIARKSGDFTKCSIEYMYQYSVDNKEVVLHDTTDLTEAGHTYLDNLRSIPDLPASTFQQAIKCRDDTEKTSILLGHAARVYRRMARDVSKPGKPSDKDEISMVTPKEEEAQGTDYGDMDISVTTQAQKIWAEEIWGQLFEWLTVND